MRFERLDNQHRPIIERSNLLYNRSCVLFYAIAGVSGVFQRPNSFLLHFVQISIPFLRDSILSTIAVLLDS